MRARGCRRLAFLLALLAAPAVARAGPELFALVPDSAGAGETIRLKGRGLSDARYVLFAAGQTVKRARFRALSDAELEVVVPDYLRAGTPAIVAVAAPTGATVAEPPSVQVVDATSAPGAAASFYRVKRGGAVPRARGVALIEDGGTVSDSDAVGLHLVRKGGLLLGFANGGGLVIHEPGALFGPKFRERTTPEGRITYMEVPTIKASPGIAPFLFAAPRQAAGAARGAPAVREIDPPAGTFGQVVAVRGDGFLGTTAVFFADGQGLGLLPAGFRVESDRLLRVEVPDPAADAGRDAVAVRSGPRPRFQLLVVINRKGATVTVPAGAGGRALREVPGLFAYVGPGQFSRGAGGVQYIDSGGVATHPAALLLLKDDARLAAANAGAIVAEPRAILPEILAKRGGAAASFRVGSIAPSPLRSPFLLREP